MSYQKCGSGRAGAHLTGGQPFVVTDYDAVMLDACAIMENEAFEAFMRSVIPKLRAAGRKLYVPQAVMKEIIYHAGANKCPVKARRALEDLRELQRMGVIEVMDSGDPMQGDYYLVRAVAAYRFEMRIAVITRDAKLMEDLLSLSRARSARTPGVGVYRLEDDGTCVPAQRSQMRRREQGTQPQVRNHDTKVSAQPQSTPEGTETQGIVRRSLDRLREFMDMLGA
ncbi:MAG: hypothetical protein E7501_05200 [Ruminococcus sp.]|nr:hypothetical protein [Ruminococcus sp.]